MRYSHLAAVVLMLSTASVEAAAQSAPPTQSAAPAPNEKPLFDMSTSEPIKPATPAKRQAPSESAPRTQSAKPPFDPNGPINAAPAPRAKRQAPSQSAPPRKDIPAIAKAANGAIVSIVMSDKDGNAIAQGTGFLISKDGRIVTNYHVIAEGASAVVKLPEGAFYIVDGVVASDKARDVAVIKAHGQNFRTLTLGNSDRVQVGEEVVAIGNPLSLESTVSNGIVSGVRTAGKLGGKFLQITAPISHGSSGGPLFNDAGEVIGITTLKVEDGENLNFAIPINDAKILLQNQSVILQDLPNKIETVAPSSAAATTQTPSTPSLETTVEFMKRMAEPEHRDVLLGELTGAELPTACGQSLTIVSNEMMWSGFTTGSTERRGYTEFTYSIVGDDGEYAQKDYPRYMSFCLRDIDPSSIESLAGC